MRATPAPTVAEQAARDIALLSPGVLPAGLRRLAEDLVLDIFGLCLAARGSDYARAALAGWDCEGGGTHRVPRARLGHEGAQPGLGGEGGAAGGAAGRRRLPRTARRVRGHARPLQRFRA